MKGDRGRPGEPATGERHTGSRRSTLGREASDLGTGERPGMGEAACLDAGCSNEQDSKVKCAQEYEACEP